MTLACTNLKIPFLALLLCVCTSGVLIFPGVTEGQNACSASNLQGANNQETCVKQSGCYYDDKSYADNIQQTCFDTKHPCVEEVDASGKTTVWGYSTEWYSDKARSPEEDSCDGDTRVHVSCGADDFIVKTRETCPAGCTSGVCSPSAPASCGNGVLDVAEQCDSGTLNSNSTNVASFCTKQCKFYFFLDKHLPFMCQIWNNVPVASDSYCKAQFGQYFQDCTIKAGKTSCITEHSLLPPNSDELHYKKHLRGTLDGHELVNTAYNGTYYFLNFKAKGNDRQSCTESDGGKNPNEKGKLTAYVRSSTTGKLERVDSVDSCAGTNPEVIEYYCATDGLGGQNVNSVTMKCPHGCRDGACLSDSSLQVTSCTDSDKGRNYYSFGRTRYRAPEMDDVDEDTCVNENTLSEQYCVNDHEKNNTFVTCANGCRDGVCITDHENIAIPPAGYEDEVLTDFSAYDNPFPDTDLNTTTGTSAAELYRRGVIGGFPDGQFKGDRFVNRAEAAKFLLLARYGIVNDISNNGRFPDVLDNQWYTKFVVTAAGRGIIKGHPSGLFKPADTVNTAEFLKMLTLTFDLQLDMSYRYSDVPSDSWFAQYAGIAQKYNLFPSRPSYLSPETPLTRADAAIAIYQYLSQR